MVRLAHLADTHIRNLNYHPEYRIIFQRIYDLLIAEKVDYIVHCGDIAHTKTQISPEYVEMCADFLKNLADIAPTYIILGNHDTNLRNQDRQDAITPIIKALNHPNLNLLKKSGEYHLNDSFVLNTLNAFDKENWVEPTDLSKINIALYHGSIHGSDTDSGWMMQHGENDISIFKDFDYAMLGDIHKTNQILDDDGRVRYPGSTIQQNHGETNDKGFLIWNIKNKNDFDVKHIQIPNPRPFISILLTPEGNIPKLSIPKGARIRVITDINFPLDTIRKALDVVKQRYEPESVTFLNKTDSVRGSITNLVDEFKKEDLRDLAVQEKLIKTFLKDYQITKDLMKKVLELNSKYDQLAKKDSIARNVEFEILELEWDNLFSYKEGNKIDFSKLSGIVGIFGKNYSGKSSIVDSLLYTIFNNISKERRKQLNIINKNSNSGKGLIKLKIGTKIFTIERKSEKYTKKLHGQETLEAKTVLDFKVLDLITGEEESLNGIDRPETDKIIGKYFGSLEDFLTTSMSSQWGALSFIEKGSTERKEILAKFLDLEFFGTKFKLANDNISELKGLVKKLEGKDYDGEIIKIAKELQTTELTIENQKKECFTIKKNITDAEKAFEMLKESIKTAPTNIIDIFKVRSDIEKKLAKISKWQAEIASAKAKLSSDETKFKKANDFLNDFDLITLQEKNQIIEKHDFELYNLITEIKSQEKLLNYDQQKISLLKEVPCGSEYSHCKFIRGAYEAQENFNIVEKLLKDQKNRKQQLSDEIKDLDPELVKDKLAKYQIIKNESAALFHDIEKQKLILDGANSSIVILEHEITNLTEKEKYYEKNKEIIENYEEVCKQRDIKKEEVLNYKIKLEDCDKKIFNLIKLHGSLEEKFNKLNEEKEELRKIREDYDAYDLFLKCMHPSGISYNIIKKSLPAINNELAKILANIADFQVYFEDENPRLEIYIKRENDSVSLPIEMCSGAEKILSAMAIRLGMISVSSLPKGDVFILDEPATALDEDNMEGFIRMLDIIKSFFKSVILISHIDSLKDAADTIINIERRDGFAYVNT